MSLGRRLAKSIGSANLIGEAEFPWTDGVVTGVEEPGIPLDTNRVQVLRGPACAIIHAIETRRAVTVFITLCRAIRVSREVRVEHAKQIGTTIRSLLAIGTLTSFSWRVGVGGQHARFPARINRLPQLVGHGVVPVELQLKCDVARRGWQRLANVVFVVGIVINQARRVARAMQLTIVRVEVTGVVGHDVGLPGVQVERSKDILAILLAHLNGGLPSRDLQLIAPAEAIVVAQVIPGPNTVKGTTGGLTGSRVAHIPFLAADAAASATAVVAALLASAGGNAPAPAFTFFDESSRGVVAAVRVAVVVISSGLPTACILGAINAIGVSIFTPDQLQCTTATFIGVYIGTARYGRAICPLAV